MTSIGVYTTITPHVGPRNGKPDGTLHWTTCCAHEQCNPNHSLRGVVVGDDQSRDAAVDTALSHEQRNHGITPVVPSVKVTAGGPQTAAERSHGRRAATPRRADTPSATGTTG
jgi:hypothetical protein